MKQNDPIENWEKQLHRELQKLPDLEAPPTLIPNVLNRLKLQQQSAWYQLSWMEWPLALRLASGALASVIVGLLAWGAGAFGELGLSQQLVAGYSELKTVTGSFLSSCMEAVGVSTGFWSNYGQTILLTAATLLFATYLTCVAAGTALYQLAWRRSA